jgi:predicted CXXCH cytochrome family protein
VFDGEEPDGYEVHRGATPLKLADIGPATLATSTPAGTRSIIVPPASDEASSGFQSYYAVVAVKDGQRWITGSVSPNPHGAAVADNVSSCEVCHEPHAVSSGRSVLGAAGADGCYRCHGMTNESRSYGFAAASDIQAQFYDETVTPLPATGSQHRNASMISTEQECTACHTPHRRPFNALPELSFPNLLRTKSSPGPEWLFGTQASPLENDFCFGCHGTDGSLIAEVAGSSAYAAAAGDHESGYVASAHSAANVPATAGASTQCQVCHAEHASPVAGLVDYRDSGTSGTGNAESGLCFKCHSEQVFKGVEPDRGDGKPYTWNDRDVWSEFTSTSSHPYLSTGGGYAAKSQAAFLLDSEVEFNTAATVNLNVWAGDPDYGDPPYVMLKYSSSVERDYDPLNLGYINTTSLYTFDVGSVANKGFDPPDPADPGSGSTSLNVDGKIYITQGESAGVGTTTRWKYTPPANSGNGVLATASPTPSAIGTGADSDVDTVHGVAFYSAGEGSAEIMKWSYGTDAWTSSIRFAVSGVETGLGIGSTIAYSPQADRLFVVNRNGATGDGILYYLDSPSTASGATDFTSTGLQVTLSTTTARHNRMARVTSSGNDYIYIVGTNSANAGRTQLISALATTPAIREAPSFPFTWGYYQMDDGSALEWDGVGTIYAIQGGGRPDLSWRAVPADPVADAASHRNWNEWGFYAENDWYGVGTSLAFAWSDPGPFIGSGYLGEGTFTTDAYTPAASVYRLGDIVWVGDIQSGTEVRLDVQGLADGVWSDVPGFTGLTGATVSVRDLDISEWESLRIVVHFYSPLHNGSPVMYSIGMTTEYESFTTGGSLTCVNCHNTHLAEEGSGVWDVSRVADPNDTRSAYTGTTTQFCLTCHDGTAPVATATASSFVPYSVTFSTMTGYFAFKGWNKSASGVSYASSGHSTTSGTRALCETCHDPHGSDNRSLLAWTRPAGFSAGVAGERDNSSSAARGSNLCLQCHGNGTLGVKAPGAPDVATATSLTYGHNVASFIGKHDSREGSLNSSTRHIECADCHDPHAAKAGTHTPGSSNAGAALVGATGVSPVWGPTNWTTAVSYEATRVTSAGGYEAYVCLRCHTALSDMRLTFRVALDPTLGGTGTFSYSGTDLAREFNPANQSGHNIVGSRSSWPKEGVADGLAYAWPFPSDAAAFRSGSGLTKNSQLTCTDCHSSSQGGVSGPHGSSTPFNLVADGVYDSYSGTYKRWYQTTLDEWNTTFLCGRCHNRASNSVHSVYRHGYFTCSSCHVAVPHGWLLPRLLRQDELPAANISPYTRSTSHKLDPASTWLWDGETDRFTAEPHGPTGADWQNRDCDAFCHGMNNARHTNSSIVMWQP